MKHKNKYFVLFLTLLVISTFQINAYIEKKIQDDTLVIETKDSQPRSKSAGLEDFSDKQYIAKLVNEYADYYGVSRRAMHLIVANESGYNYKAYNPKDGRAGCQAVGLVQFNTCYMGKGMKVEDMKNAHYSLDVLARKIAQGHGTAWTTYRLCINNEVIYYQGKQLKCDTSKVITV